MTGDETERLLLLQTEVLEAVAQGDSLPAIGRHLCQRAAQLAPDVVCSILLVDDTLHMRSLASSGLPQAYCEAVDGVPVGPSAGSCGTAAYRNQEVIVTDIATDPLWAEFKGLALPLGLRACWSTPIRNRAGQVIATFAFYFRETRGPSKLERNIVETCVHVCSLAIEHERMRERTFRLAYYDVLTGLPNRARFNQLLGEHISAEGPFGLLLLDIDHLKSVNDSIGHAAGDRLIAEVGRRLSAMTPGVTACRLGGDEFAVLIHGCDSRIELQKWAQRLNDAATGMIEMDGQSFEAHVTMGGALFGLDGEDASTLCQNADFALYHAKQVRRGGYLAFHSGLRTKMIHRIALVRQLDQALIEDRVEPHYQPIVNIESGEIVGLEALARLRLGDRIVSAGEFHSALEDPRIAYELTGKMLERVAQDMRKWLDAKINFQHVGVNVTAGDFMRGNLAERIVDIFGRAGVPLNLILLEVNEAVFMGGGDNLVPHAVEALRSRGILVALDDFGTGFASLTHLLSFPVDIVKIDRSFVSRLGINEQSEIVVSGLIDIVKKLDMGLIAEGVETSAQADALRRFGCRMAQGYLYSRPVSAGQCTTLLNAFAERRARSVVDTRRTA